MALSTLRIYEKRKRSYSVKVSVLFELYRVTGASGQTAIFAEDRFLCALQYAHRIRAVARTIVDIRYYVCRSTFSTLQVIIMVLFKFIQFVLIVK